MHGSVRKQEHGSRIPSAQRMISVEALMLLQAVIRADGQADDPTARAQLRNAIHVVCAEAHRKQCTAEQLLVEFKDALRSLPETKRVPAGTERDDLVARLVTLLIEVYYAAPSTMNTSGPSPDLEVRGA